MKSMKVFYSDCGGSSKSVRELLASQELANFVKGLPGVNFSFCLEKANHPYVVSTYKNGYTKQVSVQNLNKEDVMKHFESLRDQSIVYKYSIQFSRTWSLYSCRK